MSRRAEDVLAGIILTIITIIVILLHFDASAAEDDPGEESKGTAEQISVIVEPIEPTYTSGMQCDFYFDVKQDNSEEQEIIQTEGERENESEATEETRSEQECETTGVLQGCDPTEPGTQDHSDVPAEAEPPSVVDQQVGQDVFELLAAELNAYNIGWWYDFAVAQMMQESGGNPLAENPNGLDKGLYQYRITYWQEPGSIFDPVLQIRRYVREVYARINAGLSVEEIISRHYTSDYVTEINWQYVNDVLARMGAGQ